MEFTEGVPCWVDAMLPDVEGGKRFYGELFGWTFDEGAGPEYGHYTQAALDGRPAAALAPKPDGRMPTAWTAYLATADAAAAAARIRDAGGQVITEPVAVGPFGTMALAADPEGAVFGLWQAGTHRGFGVVREPGAFCWTEVYARDKAVVDPFYESVFGYAGHDAEIGGDDFRMWSPAGTAAGPDTAVGGRAVSASLPAEMPAHFLSYFAVADCDATAAAARRLGGRVRDEPYDIPYGRVAVLVDNQGAAFGVLQG
ncbi:VOC family protein [Streptomyces sp. G45]|uniref:VOC family protein n=1 Tax=Streptomyces sp. G45 TaxID=3406627 RepID=UPI003C271480